MKKLCIITALILGCAMFAFTQFEWQQVSSPVSENFTSVCFTDAFHGWIVSEEGSILSTTNGGSSWEITNFPAYHFKSIHFSDNNHGCAVGLENIIADSSVILVTNDGGSNWSVIDHYKFNRFNDVFFINNDIGWAVGAQDDLEMNIQFYTNDGGLTWDYQSTILQVGAELLSVHFRDENLGSTCGADGAFFITNNGGTSSWAMGISLPILNLNDIYNFGALTGCIVGNEGTALFTINNWYQYIDQITNTAENLNAVSGAPGTNFLWAVGDNGTIIYNSVYLLPWAPNVSGTTENLNDVQMLSPLEGWAVGDNGTILYFNPISTVNTSSIESTEQIYPNPTKDRFNILFEKDHLFSEVVIYNCVGKKLLSRKIVNESLPISIDIKHFEPGIYIVRLSSNQNIVTRQVVVQ